MLTILQAARLLDRTSPALYVAIHQGRLKATELLVKGVWKWFVNPADLKLYQEARYDRKLSKREDGTLLYDKSKHQFSIAQLAKILGVGKFKVYYAVKAGLIPHDRYGAAYVLSVPDLDKVRGLLYLDEKPL